MTPTASVISDTAHETRPLWEASSGSNTSRRRDPLDDRKDPVDPTNGAWGHGEYPAPFP